MAGGGGEVEARRESARDASAARFSSPVMEKLIFKLYCAMM